MSFFDKIFRSKNDPNTTLPPLKGPIVTPKIPDPIQVAIPSVPFVPFVLGVDCAHYQDGIRWGDVYANGYRFAINKATDGETGHDSHHALFRKQAKISGLIVGAGYCFNRFKADPIKQAAHLMNITGGIQAGELPLCLDVEWDNSPDGFQKYKDGGELDDAGANHVLSCLEEIERLSGMTPWVYTAKSFWGDNISEPKRFSRFPLWLNDFRAKDITELRIPSPWKRPVAWQYGEKAMAGVAGVDLNQYLGSMESLKAMVRQ